MVHPFKGTRAAQSRMARIGLGAFACTTTITIASALVTPVAGAQSSAGSAARLASAVADAQSDVDALQLGIGDLQESVNQAFVDLRDAQARAEQARRASSEAAERLAAAEHAVTEARKSLEDITRAQYRGTAQPGVVGALAGEDGQKDALDRAGYLRQRSVEKREALEAVERARTEAANEESLAREASQLASASEEDAKRAEERTRELLESRQAELAGRESELAAAQAQLSEAKAQLDQARGGQGDTEPSLATPATPPTPSTQEPPVLLDPERVAPEDIERVQRQVEQLAPEAEAPSREEVARALATAQTAQTGAAPQAEASEADAHPEPQVQFTDEVVDQAASIAAATALVGESQAPHATFADPYAARGRLSQGDAREIIGAFVGGFQTGLGLGAAGAAGAAEAVGSPAESLPQASSTVGDISDTLLALLPEVSTPDAVTEAVQETVQAAGSASVEAVIARAQSMVGTPYVWGGGDANGPTTGVNGGSVSGFDCSGLVLYAYSAAGISLPHYTGYQYQRGTQVDPSEAKRGDLLFWGPGGSQHVAIYLGDGMMIEAPQAGQNVSVVPVRWAGMSDKAVRLL